MWAGIQTSVNFDYTLFAAMPMKEHYIYRWLLLRMWTVILITKVRQGLFAIDNYYKAFVLDVHAIRGHMLFLSF